MKKTGVGSGRTGLRRRLFVLIFCLPAFFIFSENTEAEDFSEKYFPVILGSKWVYRGYMKAKPDEEKVVQAQVVEKREIDKKEYYFYSAPLLDIKYFLRKTTDGIFMKVIKYPFSIFKFIIEVDLHPEMKVISFPIKPGDKWNYEGTGTAKILGLFSVKRNIKAVFEVAGRETVETQAGKNRRLPYNIFY